MAKLVTTVDPLVHRLWNKFQVEMPKLGAELRPKKASEVFSYDEDANGVHVTARQVCFHLKERAGLSITNLFVALEGIITFDPSSTRDELRTLDFKTRAGYFREIEPRRLAHVYGVHYDRDDAMPAHPVFHSQVASMRDLASFVNSNFHRQFNPVANNDDFVLPLLPNVRIPTAYMDLFSAMLQVVGDHTIYKDSDANRRGSFQSLQRSVGVFRSSMAAATRLGAVLDQQCFRAGHWYP